MASLLPVVPAGGARAWPCPRCTRPLFITDGMNACPSCRREFEAATFNPPQIVSATRRLEEAGEEGVPCAVHELNAAVAACERCGVFLCDLCRIPSDGASVCPGCFEILSRQDPLRGGGSRVRNYTGLASMCLAIGFILCVYFGLILGPAAVVFAWKGWKQRRAMGREGGTAMMVVQAVLGLAEAVGQAAMIVAMIVALVAEH